MFWMKKAWWKSVLEVTKRERAGLISLFVLLGLLGWITRRYSSYEQREVVAWSIQQLPNPPAPSQSVAGPREEGWRARGRHPQSESYPRKRWERVPSTQSSNQSQWWSKQTVSTPTDRFGPATGKPTWPTKVWPKKVPKTIDVNEADSLAWLQLPGIGPQFTRRILRFRAKLGGFFELRQVGEAFGLPDSTFQLIRPYLQLEQLPRPWLNVNTADLETLSAHPYISQSLARHIIAYRQQHGGFKQASDLLEVRLMSDSLWRKLSPYIIIN